MAGKEAVMAFIDVFLACASSGAFFVAGLNAVLGDIDTAIYLTLVAIWLKLSTSG